MALKINAVQLDELNETLMNKQKTDYHIIRRKMQVALNFLIDNVESCIREALHYAKGDSTCSTMISKMQREACTLGKHLADTITSIYETQEDEEREAACKLPANEQQTSAPSISTPKEKLEAK